MLTDAPPHKKNRQFFLESDWLRSIDLPADGRLCRISQSIEAAMKARSMGDVRRHSAEFVAAVSDFYRVPNCDVHVLAARPLRTRRGWRTELFGDYHPATMLIRVWMRTAVQKEITSFGTFLSTLCHEELPEKSWFGCLQRASAGESIGLARIVRSSDDASVGQERRA